MPASGVVANSFVFTATCGRCGARLVVDGHDAPTATIRRCTGSCLDPKCGAVYRFTLTMRLEPDRAGAARG